MHSDKIDGFLKKRKTADQAGGQDRIPNNMRRENLQQENELIYYLMREVL